MERRLQEWGEWCGRSITGLSYPSRTVEARLMEQGVAAAMGARPRADPPGYMGNSRAAEVHRVIRDMPHRAQIVAYAHYVVRCRYQGARHLLNCSRTEYYRILDRVLHYVAGRLGYDVDP